MKSSYDLYFKEATVYYTCGTRKADILCAKYIGMAKALSFDLDSEVKKEIELKQALLDYMLEQVYKRA